MPLADTITLICSTCNYPYPDTHQELAENLDAPYCCEKCLTQLEIPVYIRDAIKSGEHLPLSFLMLPVREPNELCDDELLEKYQSLPEGDEKLQAVLDEIERRNLDI